MWEYILFWFAKQLSDLFFGITVLLLLCSPLIYFQFKELFELTRFSKRSKDIQARILNVLDHHAKTEPLEYPFLKRYVIDLSTSNTTKHIFEKRLKYLVQKGLVKESKAGYTLYTK